MNVLLTPPLEAFVKKKVESGEYQDANDLICDVLSDAAEREQFHQDWIIREGRKGFESLQAGRKTVVNSKEEFLANVGSRQK